MKLFLCDYEEGCHPQILNKLIETNMDQTPGYGLDKYSDNARELIKKRIGRMDADVHFLVGGTQTNATVIASALRPYEGVVCANTGHINVHETGAVEATGHKVIGLDQVDAKITAAQISDVMEEFLISDTQEHVVEPKMVYISYPTELGTIYSKKELEDIYNVTRKYGLYLFIDGARLGYGLMSDKSDLTIEDIASLCDVFYIGGTKVGCLFGEAVVILNDSLKKGFRSMIKHQGGMLAKGRLLGIQFETLFTDDLYFKISKNAIDTARYLRSMLEDKGYSFYADSPTNQQFPILDLATYEKVKGICEVWARPDSEHIAVRFCTSWATTTDAIDELGKVL